MIFRIIQRMWGTFQCHTKLYHTKCAFHPPLQMGAFRHRLVSRILYFKSLVLHKTLIEDQVVAADRRIQGNQTLNLPQSKPYNMFQLPFKYMHLL